MGDQAGRKDPPKREPRKLVFDARGRVWWRLVLLAFEIAFVVWLAWYWWP